METVSRPSPKRFGWRTARRRSPAGWKHPEPSLHAVRAALEEVLGIRFEGERGAQFFRSTLVQALFYGVFSAWVLCARADSPSVLTDVPPGNAGVPPASFHWCEAVWHLRAPVLQALFQQISAPSRLHPLGLVEVLDWTAAALGCVDRATFFARFNAGDAVLYFYEPFLEAFDPALRKQLGIWYTPAEVVRYMVARVDKALKARPRHCGRLSRRQRVRLGPVLRHRGVSGRSAASDCGEPARQGLGRVGRGRRQESGNRAGVRLRDHAGAVRGGASASRLDPASTRRPAHGRPSPIFLLRPLSLPFDRLRDRERVPRPRRPPRHLPHECADRLGAAHHQTVALPRTGGRTRPGGTGETGHADSRDPG